MPNSSQKVGEANFKVAVFQEYFGKKKFTYMQEIDRIDFIITDNADRHLIWAETKKNTADIVEMFVQLILTIGKARTFDRYNPPPFLCVFDYQKIAFLQYNAVHDIFYQNDFNWNVTPSDHKTKEFTQIKYIVDKTVEDKRLLFSFDNDNKILKEFIKKTFSANLDETPELFISLQIDKNNFVPTYNRWIEMVKPSIAIDWEIAKKKGIIDGNFYLADLLSENNITLKEKLFVLLKKTNYELDRQLDDMGLFTSKTVQFKDGGLSHRHFWELYARPHKEEYWDYIVDRRDLLVPQDIRERRGSFFTPQIWVQKSQEYLTKAFGENWQDEYYVWDCAAGTGNLLVGLTNKYNLWASTLDRQDVDVMKDRIKHGANLLESHVFQFDFLNDSFDKLPEGLKEIIDDTEKRKKLIIYINPPYAESNSYWEKSKKGLSFDNETYNFKEIIGAGIKELFIQFFLQVYIKIPGVKLATFGKLKYINSQYYLRFREFFKAECKGGFICCADTFDNVKGKFPIGFLIWDTEKKKKIEKIIVDIFEKSKEQKVFRIGKKSVFTVNSGQYLINWLRYYYDKEVKNIAYLRMLGADFQTNNQVYITSKLSENDLIQKTFTPITKNNILEISIYFSIRHCIEANWINDRDQFLFPNKNWEKDVVFKNNCLIFSLFHTQNRIQSQHGINHWIPFTAQEVGAKDNFKSSFMSDYIEPKKFSKEAKAVLKVGRELWKYYHSKIAGHRNAKLNASFYDIRDFFQGRSESGNMRTKSADETYNSLIKELRQKMFVLAEIIKPKVYEYGFLVK